MWRTEWTVAFARAVIATASRYRDNPIIFSFGLHVRTPLPFDLRHTVRVRRVKASGFEADRYTTQQPSKGTLLYFHGGGYLFGNPGTHRQFIARLVRVTGAEAFAPTYRLAPRWQYPAAVDDAEAAYRHLLALGIEPSSIVIAGDSAGGGLAMALMHRLGERGLPTPAGAILFSPYLDLEHRTYTIPLNASTDYLPLIDLSKANDWYAPRDALQNPEVSPLNAELADFPPLLVFAGGAEMLLGDSLALADRAQEAGADLELVVEPEMVHVWPAIVEWEPASSRAFDTVADWYAAIT